MRQSERGPAYAEALDRLWEMGLLYPCTCTRRDIAEAASAPQEGAEPMVGPDGLVYPGTCRPVGPRDPGASRPGDTALRLDMRRALDRLGVAEFAFEEEGEGLEGEHGQIVTSRDYLVEAVGDIALARKDMAGSYHLSVVLDDAAQGVTLVPRGRDLFDATRIHVVLQDLLGLPRPRYHHHRLIRDEGGRRLAKRDDARSIAAYREDGATPEDLRRLLGLPLSSPAT